MDVSLRKANEHRNAWFEGVQKCILDETLYVIMERIVRAEVHRLVITDETEMSNPSIKPKVIGIISLSDILYHLVLRPMEMEKSVSGSMHSLRSFQTSSLGGLDDSMDSITNVRGGNSTYDDNVFDERSEDLISAGDESTGIESDATTAQINDDYVTEGTSDILSQSDNNLTQELSAIDLNSESSADSIVVNTTKSTASLTQSELATVVE